MRPPAVAGTFYPGSPAELRSTVARLLASAPPATAPCPKALVVPHAGYAYSGPTAAAAFVRIAPCAGAIERVVLVGPAHRAYVADLASPGAERMATPLGEMVVDIAAVAALAASPAAHAREHSLEVMLPFLQVLVPQAKLVPMIGCDASPSRVAAVLEAVWGGPETLIVISSDLSHYLPYEEGRARDEHTAVRILAFDETLDGDDACGAVGIDGLARVARRRHMRGELVALTSSGARDHERGVGYGAFAFHEAA